VSKGVIVAEASSAVYPNPFTSSFTVRNLPKGGTKLRTNMANRQSAATKHLSILPTSAEELQAKAEKSKLRYTGFVAQEVEQAAKKLGYDFSGVDAPKEKDGMYGLRYAEFVVPLVKAVQEQQKKRSRN
jgi:hypothetical protein